MKDLIVYKLVELLSEGAKSALTTAREVAAGAPKKMGESLLKSSTTLLEAGARAAWARLRSSAVHDKFHQLWLEAGTRIEQETVVRDWLTADPRLEPDLSQLLYQRSYLNAVYSRCQLLPFLSSVFETSLEEVFVELSIELNNNPVEPGSTRRALRTPALIDLILANASSRSDVPHYVCFSAPGSGKTTLYHWLLITYCRRVLLDESRISDLDLRLPAYVRATDLADIAGPFEHRLHRAIENSLGASLPSAMDAELLQHDSSKSRRWLIIIDGIDEISEPEKRIELLRAIRGCHIDVHNTFQFLLSCRDSAVAQAAFDAPFRIIRLPGISKDETKLLYQKYARALRATCSTKRCPAGGRPCGLPRFA